MNLKQLHSIKNETATIFLYDRIGQTEKGGVSGTRIAELINVLDSMDDVEDIKIRINSGGGSVLDGWSIFSAIRNAKKPVYTYVDGIAASIAGVIFLAGAKRYISDFGKMMIHDPFPVGESADSEKAKNAANSMRDGLLTILENNSNISREVLNDVMRRETWLGATEALKAGFADEILSTKRVIDVENITTNELFTVMNHVHSKNLKTRNKMKDVLNFLNLDESTDEAKVLETVKALKNSIENKATELETISNESKNKAAEIEGLKAKIAEFEAKEEQAKKDALEAKVDNAINDGLFNAEDKAALVQKFENNAEALDLVIKTAIKQPVDVMNAAGAGKGSGESKESLRDLEKNNPVKLEQIRNEQPELYAVMFEEQYGVKYKG